MGVRRGLSLVLGILLTSFACYGHYNPSSPPPDTAANQLVDVNFSPPMKSYQVHNDSLNWLTNQQRDAGSRVTLFYNFGRISRLLERSQSMKVKLASLLARRKECTELVKQLQGVNLAGFVHTEQTRKKADQGLEDVVARIPKVSISEVTAKYDFYAGRLEEVDGLIQFANWNTNTTVQNEVFDEWLGSATPKESNVELARLLLRRAYLAKKVLQLDTILKNAASTFEPKITRRPAHEGIDDVTIVASKVKREELESARDFYSKRLRLVDQAIQHCNWTVDVEVLPAVLEDYPSDGKVKIAV